MYGAITENWPDDDETASRNAMRQSLFPLHNELAAFLQTKLAVILHFPCDSLPADLEKGYVICYNS